MSDPDLSDAARRAEPPAAWAAVVAASAELARWFASPPGRYILAWEQAQFDERVVDIFGFNAVQLGLAQIDALRASRMPHVLRVGESMREIDRLERGDRSEGPAVVSRAPSVLTRFEELPFASQSIDLLVLPHALELSPDPHALLREAERVLVPEGKLVMTCFNPYSLWGIRQMIGTVSGSAFLPRAGQFISVPRLKDWLKLLSFDVEGGRFGCYRPAARSDAWLGRTAFLDKAGDRWWPVFGAVYMLAAVKRVKGMRLIGPAWKTQRAPASVVAPAAHRGARVPAEAEA